MKRPAPFPTWLSVLAVLEQMDDALPVTLLTFREANAEREWHFAVRNHGPDGPTGSHPGPSPWVSLVRGQRARTVRRLLPIWIANRVLTVVTAEDLSNEIIGDPHLRRRHELANQLADHLLAHPDDWPWLSNLLAAMDPDPFRISREDADDLPFDDPPRRNRTITPPANTSAPLGAEVPLTASPRPNSSRPMLRRLRADHP